MLPSVKFYIYTWLLMHSAFITLQSSIVDKHVPSNVTKAKELLYPEDKPQLAATPAHDHKSNDQLKLLPTPLLVEEHDAVVKELQHPQKELVQMHKNSTDSKNDNKEEMENVTENPANVIQTKDSPPSPLNDASHQIMHSNNRTGRQLYYSPNIYYIQNIAAEGSKCITSRGLVGVCMDFGKCQLQQQQPRYKRQLIFYTAPQVPYYTTPYATHQQVDICSFSDQYGRPNSGICCIGYGHVTPLPPSVQPIHPLQPDEEKDNELKPTDHIYPSIDIETTAEDSDVLEPPTNFLSYQPDPPKYDNTELQDANHIDYDPIDDNLKQAQVFGNYIRYPWPSQFLGFSGVQQWPPPLPTHPPSATQWPPPIPTHPPNHHYPTHPPGSPGQFPYPATTTTTKRPSVVVTTRKPPSPYPSYPSFPTYRPTAATTTTKRPFADNGVTPAGLPLQCGTRNTGSPDQERIVGGTNASPNEFPWIAVLFKSGKQFCGGSLITNSHILTAAHCVARMTSWDVAALTVHLGDYNIRTDYEVQHVSRRIKRLVRHKGFDFSILHNDVAVLTLSEPVKYTKEIQPICMPTTSSQQARSYSGHIATVAGWGSLRESGPQPSVLQKVQIPIWTNADCAQKYGRAAPGGIIESMICAGQASKDSCSGDSGGPLIVNEGGRYVQVGIVSWGIGCGKGQYPGVYTRVTSLLPWIYKNLK